jgi:N-methylhydantoinase A/oxoprolinase/acetone carboxylase beta subunit
VSVDLRLGIDVGGTNTDAVLLQPDDALLASAKVPTTPDVTGGIVGALEQVIATADVAADRITHLMLGTTHATNAILERRGLERVATIRIGAPATASVRPLFDWPEDLRAAISVGETIVRGGSELDGRDIVAFEPQEVRRFLEDLPEEPTSVAITSVFSPVSPAHERLAEEEVRDVLGDVPISLGHEIGSIGLIERENATVLNAALVSVARRVLEALRTALDAQGADPVILFAQNDGTLMAIEQALRLPVMTIGSGPANSLRGAAHLTGMTSSLVADIGGTSTDVGMLVNGYPRESHLGRTVAGIRTNFRVPDLVTVALGGGTVVHGDANDPTLGPESVGFRLEQEALVFGGGTPTLTDAAVATDRAALGDPSRVEPHRELLEAAIRKADAMFAEAVERMKTSKQDVPLVVVGGGSILSAAQVEGVSVVDRPGRFDVANAVGAALAAVSGEVDRVIRFDGRPRDEVIDELKHEALDRAIESGADASRTEVVEIDEVPLTYLFTPASRVRVRAAGPLSSL